MQKTTPPALGIASSGLASLDVGTERGLAPPILLHYLHYADNVFRV
jgi:hypothetical protein